MNTHIKQRKSASNTPLKPIQENFPLTLLSKTAVEEGQLLIYYASNPFILNACILDNDNPKKLLWQSRQPLWKTRENIKPEKIIVNNRIISFHYRLNRKRQKTTFLLDTLLNLPKKPIPDLLKKISQNPILEPKSNNRWESQYVYNTAALYLNGKVHFIYRAIGHSGLSVFGYAASRDGIHIEERSTVPVYACSRPLPYQKENVIFSPYAYTSGGSWSGCEDPRLTKIDDRIYMTYTAFNSWDSPPGVALTSISVNDFLNKHWNWKNPILLSPPYEMHKNWVLFPEKIKGKYALLHSIAPDILIDYFDNLEFENSNFIQSHYQSVGRENDWDNCIRGVGAPPIKTSAGWLVLYHAMDKKDPNKYKIGAMILEENNPTNILYRSSYPLLEPDAPYENKGFKAGVVYNCGAVVISDTLFIYYGGADTVVCAAYVNLNRLITQLKNSGTSTLNQTMLRVCRQIR